MNNEPRTFSCDFCRDEHPLSELVHYQGLDLCRECYENETSYCDVCGERVWDDDLVCDGRIEICPSCFEAHYTRCDHCDRIIHLDDACYVDDDEDVPYCHECAQNLAYPGDGIQCYSYKPIPIFHGDGFRFMGVELEIDRGGELNENARALMSIANSDADNMYIKHDGSITDGMELVTHPMTLEYHQNQMPWQEILHEAVSMGYRSHQTTTCGLHVHVNRNSFGKTIEQPERAIARVLFFVENCWHELLRFTRRIQNQMDQWAARYGRKNTPKEMMDHVKENFAGRYTCVNLTNSATIEFRLFRGTLRYNTLIATLQLVNEICNVAIAFNDVEMSHLTWTDFVVRVGFQGYPELVRYLKERRLYVSDPVDDNEEEM